MKRIKPLPIRGKAPYNYDDLKTVEWNDVRVRILKSHNLCCFRCGVTGVRLSVHHTYYEADKRAWEYPDSSLVPLCDICHTREHIITNDMVFIIEWLLDNEKPIGVAERKDFARELNMKLSAVINLLKTMDDYGFVKKHKEKGLVFYTLDNRYRLFYPYFDIMNPTEIKYSNEVSGIVMGGKNRVYVGDLIHITTTVKVKSFEVFEDGSVKPIFDIPEISNVKYKDVKKILYKEI